jgi:glycosyltransferase involved in cell wall biosynthesis
MTYNKNKNPSSLNIVFLSTTIPYPPVDGHSQRTYYLLKHLAERHRIHLIGFVKKPEDWDSANVLRKFCAGVYPFVLPEDVSRIDLGLSLICNLFSSDPFVVRKYLHRPTWMVMEKIFQGDRIHLIHCDMPNLIPYAAGGGSPPYASYAKRGICSPYVKSPYAKSERDGLATGTSCRHGGSPLLQPDGSGPPAITVHHDLEWMLMDRRAQMASNPCKKWYFSWQAQKWQRYLYKIEMTTRLHVVVSDLDRQRLEEISPLHVPVRVAPNGVDVEYFQPQPAIPAEKMVLFLGGMHVFQNADGVEYFLKSVWPKIQDREKGVKCLIIGQNPSKQIQSLANEKGAQVLGFVEDVRPFLARAGLMVVPIRIGSGTRLKILSAMAMAKVVVSTSVGCEGIEARDGQELLIADSADDMARQVAEVLQNPSLQKRLGENGRKLVEEKYSWARIARIMDDVYQEAVETGHP